MAMSGDVENEHEAGNTGGHANGINGSSGASEPLKMNEHSHISEKEAEISDGKSLKSNGDVEGAVAQKSKHAVEDNTGSNGSNQMKTGDQGDGDGDGDGEGEGSYSDDDELIQNKDDYRTKLKNRANSPFVPIELDSSLPDLENVEILSKHYQIPNILIKSLFDLNKKRNYNMNNQPMESGSNNDNVNEFILNLESEIIEFIIESNVDSWKMQSLNSYYRLLSHQLAEYYHLGHILSNDGTSMVLFKINTSLINADDETKKKAKFDQTTGNIKPLDFRNLKFDPSEKLNRINLSDLYKSYKNFFKKDNSFDEEIAANLDSMHIGNNFNGKVRIMQRKYKSNNSHNQNAHIGYNNGRTDPVNKEERYNLAKQRIKNEEGETDEGNYEDDDDVEVELEDNNGSADYYRYDNNSMYLYKDYPNNGNNKFRRANDRYNNRHFDYYQPHPLQQNMYRGPTGPLPVPSPHAPPYGYMMATNPNTSIPSSSHNLTNSPNGGNIPVQPYYYIPIIPPPPLQQQQQQQPASITESDSGNNDEISIEDGNEEPGASSPVVAPVSIPAHIPVPVTGAPGAPPIMYQYYYPNGYTGIYGGAGAPGPGPMYYYGMNGNGKKHNNNRGGYNRGRNRGRNYNGARNYNNNNNNRVYTQQFNVNDINRTETNLAHGNREPEEKTGETRPENPMKPGADNDL